MLLGAVGLEEFHPRCTAERVFIACGALQGLLDKLSGVRPGCWWSGRTPSKACALWWDVEQ